MNTKVEALEGNKVRVSVEVDETEFEPAVDAAFRKIAKEVRIPGFRPGKAPRRILEQRLGAGYGRAQAMNDSLPEFYSRAVIDNEVDVIAPPDIEVTGGAESGAVTFEAVVEVRPVITLSGYADLAVTIPSPNVSDDEIEAQLERVRNQYAELEVVERAASAGDYLTIDIEGSQDGEVLDGLVAQAYLYELGSAGIVPELDEQLEGASAGDARSFDAKHPNDDESDLHFEVTVVDVKAKVLPELDDEFAKTASEFDTVEAWRADLVERMGQVRKAQSQMNVREKIGEALAGLVTDDLPEPLVTGEMNERLQDMALRLQAQGLTIDQWLQFSGTEPDQFVSDLRDMAERSARVDLALRAIALAEGISVDDDDVEAEFEAVASRVGSDIDEVRARLTEGGQVGVIRIDIAKRKSLDWLTERVTITDDDGNSIAFDSLALDEPGSEETTADGGTVTAADEADTAEGE